MPYITSSRLSSSPCSWTRRRRRRRNPRMRVLLLVSSRTRDFSHVARKEKKTRLFLSRAARRESLPYLSRIGSGLLRVRRLLYLSALSPSSDTPCVCLSVRCAVSWSDSRYARGETERERRREDSSAGIRVSKVQRYEYYPILGRLRHRNTWW